MEQEKKCPECSCTEFAQGTFGADSKLFPINIIFKPGKGSEVLAEICTKCGYILNMRVSKPEKFK
ncbi:transcription initiation factor TFIIIB [Clostridium aciditolerans]|uniref:Transcription initiation factor TFIIIB n=1 Tax=Clostridium aciditolerans TaxID=339861 RepID=A0A934HU10_9CLOT|nr:transcription initiation factor TFIIIB [Clostridium aciditolerans]MBI6874521.1 transcription initiation factor TFIIIB [Clostridium aciditolerans]